MLIAAISDIHGNKYALKSVLQSISREKVDYIVNCGDICGYYFDQNDVIDQLREFRVVNEILGNHDYAFLRTLSSDLPEGKVVSNYCRSYSMLAKSITEENLQTLKNLKRSFSMRFGDLLINISHSGDPNDLEVYFYEDSSLETLFEQDTNIVIYGHTHYAFAKQIANSKLIVNPGSVGQPRDGKPPSYALIDTDTKKAEIVRVEYDTSELKSDLARMSEVKGYRFQVIDRWR